MNFKILLLAFVILFVNKSSFGLDGVILEEDNDARLYMAAFLQMNGSHIWISCTGTFIKENFVVTAATCIDSVEVDRLHVRSGQTKVWLAGSGASILDVTIHPKFKPENPFEHNIAVVKIDTAVKPIETLHPRSRDRITPNRYCTMLGWEGYDFKQSVPVPLRMFPVPVSATIGCDSKAPGAYCSTQGLTSPLAKCGGLMGAPIFCAGEAISGIVVNDNFCKESDPVGGSFITLADYKVWIDEIMMPPTTTAPTTTAGAVNLFTSKALLVLLVAYLMRM